MSAKALLIDPATGDLDVSAHRLRLTSEVPDGDKVYVSQRIKQRIGLFLAEWYLNVRKGVPYYRDILIKNPDLDLIESIFSEVIVGTNGVSQLTEYTQTITGRTLNVTFSCVTTTGEILANQSIDVPF